MQEFHPASAPRSNARPAGKADIPAPAIGVLDEIAGYHLRRAAGVFGSDYARVLADTGIRQALFGILSIIAANPGINQGNVGRVLGIQPANMVSLANELAERGLLERDVVAGDRRTFALRLTRAGKAMVRTCLERIHEHERRLLCDFSDEEQRILIDLLRRIEAKGSAEAL